MNFHRLENLKYNILLDDYKNFKLVTSMIYIFNLHIATELKFDVFNLIECMSVQNRTHNVLNKVYILNTIMLGTIAMSMSIKTYREVYTF